MENYLIGVLTATVIPTIFQFIINRKLNKTGKQLDEKKEDEKRFNIIIIQAILALGENNKAMFEALKSGKTNGNLDKALENYNKVQENLNYYLVEKASRD